jgi:hypothetical protein
MPQDWGNFFDQSPTTEAGIPVAAMRAAVRPAGGPFGKSVAFPAARPMAPSSMLQSPPQPRMDAPLPPDIPKVLPESNELGNIAKGLAGAINPEEDKKKDDFGDRMSAIDAQLQAMAEERQKMAAAVASSSTSGGQGQGQAQGKAVYGGTGAGSGASGNEGFNFNVGNLRTSGINWAGKGQPHNGFETFDTPEAGAAAMYHNLASYASASPDMTLGGAIAKWAPPSENNTTAYISHVAQSAGIDPNTPLATVLSNPDAAAKMMLAMAKMEKGGGLSPAFTIDLFRTVAGGKPAEAQPQTQPQQKAEGGRIRYLRSLVGS